MDNSVRKFQRRFMQLCEMTIPTSLAEADDDQNNGGGDPNMGGGMPMGGGDPNMGGGMPMGGGDPNMGGGMPMGGGDPNMGGGDPNMMGGDPNMMGGGQDGGAQMPQGFDPQVDGQGMGGDAGFDTGMDPNMMGGDPNMGGDMPSEDDNVVDISELTDAQDETQDKIEHLNDKFGEIMKHIGAFEELLRSNDHKIEDLKAEFEKRNPTQIEKLNLQTAKSYPFTETPDNFWKQKEATSNYSTEPDNNGVGQGQYVITKDDVNGDVNWKSIADSLEDKDFIYNQTLDGVLKI